MITSHFLDFCCPSRPEGVEHLDELSTLALLFGGSVTGEHHLTALPPFLLGRDGFRSTYFGHDFYIGNRDVIGTALFVGRNCAVDGCVVDAFLAGSLETVS